MLPAPSSFAQRWEETFWLELNIYAVDQNREEERENCEIVEAKISRLVMQD